jgi:hypothetical protein
MGGLDLQLGFFELTLRRGEELGEMDSSKVARVALNQVFSPFSTYWKLTEGNPNPFEWNQNGETASRVISAVESFPPASRFLASYFVLHLLQYTRRRSSY